MVLMRDKLKDAGKKIDKIGWMMLFMLIPVIAATVFCMAQNVSPFQIYLPNSLWNDEVFYYKQIEGVVQYGEPQGYFGYNESAAQMGTLGAWSPVIYLPWIIWGNLFGWNLRAPILCNLFLLVLAFMLFYMLVQPTNKSVIYMIVLTSLFTPISRYVFSCTPETIVNALAIICTGLVVSLSNRDNTQRFLGKWICLIMLVILLTLMRPYFVLGFLFIAYLGYMHTDKKRYALGAGLLAIVTICIYFYIVERYCASYFGPLIDFSWVKLIFTSPIQGIINAIYMFFSASKQYLQLMGTGVISGGLVGGWAVVYVLLLGWITYRLYMVQMQEHKILYGILLVCFLLMLMADFYLYDVKVGTRHLMAWIVVGMFVLGSKDGGFREKLGIAIVFCWLFVVMALPEYDYKLPTFQAEENYMTIGEKLPSVEANAKKGWDYTVAWSLSAPHKALYSLPPGYGISCCFDAYLIENFDSIKSRYLIVLSDSEIDGICRAKNKKVIEEVDSIKIYTLR